MGPLTIAGFRYFLAFLILFPFFIQKEGVRTSISKGLWLRLFLIGISAYTIGNGALFWGLKYLPATTVSFLMSLSPLIILFGGAVWLKETPTRWQVLGVIVSLLGSGMFFSSGLQPGQSVGITIILIGLIGFVFWYFRKRNCKRETTWYPDLNNDSAWYWERLSIADRISAGRNAAVNNRIHSDCALARGGQYSAGVCSLQSCIAEFNSPGNEHDVKSHSSGNGIVGLVVS